MRAVDTNVLVRLVTRDNMEQLRVSESFVGEGAWVSLLTLAETVWVLSTVYERDAAEVCNAVEMLLDHRTLTLQDADVVTEALESFREHRGVAFSDCLVLEIARKAGHLPFGTFDRRLARLPGAEAL